MTVIHNDVVRASMWNRPQQRTTLDANNNRFVLENRFLHPTRGWRKISVKRTLIQDITNRIRAGQHGLDQPMVRKILNREVFL